MGWRTDESELINPNAETQTRTVTSNRIQLMGNERLLLTEACAFQSFKCLPGGTFIEAGYDVDIWSKAVYINELNVI